MSRAAQHVLFDTTDPDEGHDFLARAYSANEMRVRGAREDFALRYEYRADGPLNLARCTYGLAIEHRVDPLGMLLLARVRRGAVERTTAGRTARLSAGDVFLVADPDEPYRIAWDDDVDLDLLAVDLTRLGDLAPSPDNALPRFEVLEPLSAEAGLRCSAALDLARHSLADVDGAGPLLLDNVARTVAATVLAGFPHRQLDATADSLTLRARTVRRAVEFMEEHAGRPLGLQEIARAAHVAPRTLQLAFRSELDTTPTDHLRQIRLGRAHRDLLAADPGSGATVTEVAMRWGFTHPSRFAMLYRQAFGRLPRESLQAGPSA